MLIGQDNRHSIEIAIQYKASFLTDKNSKLFYKKYDNHDEDHRICHNHINLSTVDCASRFCNLLAIHLLSTFSYNPDPKYITSYSQQLSASYLGVFLTYQQYLTF